MSESDHDTLVREVIEANRYLALSTTDGTQPWVATLEYIFDGESFYFFSPTDSRHARHIDQEGTVAVAIWGSDQPEYGPDVSTTLRGVQIRARARRLPESAYPEAVAAAVEALDPPMPPYAAFEILPKRAYAPVLEDGVNERVTVEL